MMWSLNWPWIWKWVQDNTKIENSKWAQSWSTSFIKEDQYRVFILPEGTTRVVFWFEQGVGKSKFLASIKYHLAYYFILGRVKSCLNQKYCLNGTCLNRKTTVLENLMWKFSLKPFPILDSKNPVNIELYFT